MGSSGVVRGLGLAAMCAVLCALVMTETIPLLAWTDAFVRPGRYPALFAAYFATWLAVRGAPTPELRRLALVGGSLVTGALMDPVFTFASVVWVIGLHRVLFGAGKPRLRGALAYVGVTVLALALACNTDLWDAGEEVGQCGQLFALSYTFRLAWLFHEVRLRREVVPLADLVTFFVFAPFFVIVPYMMAIPRCDQFRSGLPAHDRALEASGLRLMAWGVVLVLAFAAVSTWCDPRVPLRAAGATHDMPRVLLYGVLSYPAFGALQSTAIGAVLVGMVRVLGFPLGPSFQRPMLATSVTEWWRRWNTHFRDLLVALFYYPVVMRLRRHRTRAIAFGCAAVFLIGSPLFHLPKHYFARRTLVPPIGIVVEGVLVCALVVWSLLREQRGTRPWLPRPLAMVATWLLIYAAVGAGLGVQYLVLGERMPVYVRH